MGKRGGGAFGKVPAKNLKAGNDTLHEGARPWVDRMKRSLEKGSQLESSCVADHSKSYQHVVYEVCSIEY